MQAVTMFLLLNGCTGEPEDPATDGGAEDGGTGDGGFPGDGGGGASADGGGASGDGGAPDELCREVISEYDLDKSPRNPAELTQVAQGLQTIEEAHWEVSLDGTMISDVPLIGTGTVGYTVLVDWVADGSAEAIYPCMDGPATRIGIGVPTTVDGGQADGKMWGFIDGNETEMWYTRVRTNDVTYSASWQALVDAALEKAGHPEARPYMELTYVDGEGVHLGIGAEAGAWSAPWWYGVLDE